MLRFDRWTNVSSYAVYDVLNFNINLIPGVLSEKNPEQQQQQQWHHLLGGFCVIYLKVNYEYLGHRPTFIFLLFYLFISDKWPFIRSSFTRITEKDETYLQVLVTSNDPLAYGTTANNYLNFSASSPQPPSP